MFTKSFKTFCLAVLVAFLGMGLPTLVSAAEVESKTCEPLLIPDEVQALFGPEGLELTQAQRLFHILTNMPEDQRLALYQIFNIDDPRRLNAIARAIREGNMEELPAQLSASLSQFPTLSMFLLDLIEFGDSFPGIFGLNNADATILKVLESVQQREISDVTGNPDLLKSQSMAPRLSRSIDNLLVSLIRQGNDEAMGLHSNRGFWSRLFYGIKRWFLPPYKRVELAISTGKFFQKQLHRYRLVDQLIVRQALSHAVSLGLTEAEVGEIAAIVLDSPEEILEIEKLVQEIFHPDFAIGRSVAEGDLDIYGISKRAKEKNLEEILRGYDEVLVQTLERLNEVLSAALQRRGQEARTPDDYKIEELRLYFGAYHRGMDRNEEDYDAWLARVSNESYTVEEEHVIVHTETDDKGNTTISTETYMTSETVRPSFYNILSDSYDLGDGSVWGLSEVRSRAAAMVARESAHSEQIEALEDYIQEVLDNYNDAVMKGIDDYEAGLLERLPQVEQRIVELNDYLAWSDQQILNQYSNDNIEVFRNRNREMLERYKNMRKLIMVLAELLDRNELQYRIAFDLWDYTDWMIPMREEHRNNLIQKVGLGAITFAAGTGYVVSPEFRVLVDEWAMDVVRLLEGAGL